jgi:hypothetical protein
VAGIAAIIIVGDIAAETAAGKAQENAAGNMAACDFVVGMASRCTTDTTMDIGVGIDIGIATKL